MTKRPLNISNLMSFHFIFYICYVVIQFSKNYIESIVPSKLDIYDLIGDPMIDLATANIYY